MQKRNFVIRTIRNGQVKINGRIFRPDNLWMEYDGRLDGMRYAFGLYWEGDTMLEFAGLWGSEEAYKAASDEGAWEKYCGEHPQDLEPEVVDAYYPWATWNTTAYQQVVDERRRRFEEAMKPKEKQE
jgi:hypothetical protein